MSAIRRAGRRSSRPRYATVVVVEVVDDVAEVDVVGDVVVVGNVVVGGVVVVSSSMFGGRSGSLNDVVVVAGTVVEVDVDVVDEVVDVLDDATGWVDDGGGMHDPLGGDVPGVVVLGGAVAEAVCPA
jgi:hypothetical protein